MPWRDRVVGAGIALMAIVATVAVLVGLRGRPSDSSAGLAGHSPAPQPRQTSAAPAPSVRPSVSRRASPPAGVHPRVHRTAPPPAITRPPLTVLNNSTITGLGAASARRFESAGWQVQQVGSLTGRYRVITVYYAPGQLEAARLLARQFPSIGDIEPRSAAPRLPGTGLTVVVTRDFG